MYTDAEMFNTFKTAQTMLPKGATISEIMNLVSRILEHDLDVKTNVNYLVNGLLERAVFEFGKKNVLSEW